MNNANFLLFPSSSIFSRVVNPGFLKLQMSGATADERSMVEGKGKTVPLQAWTGPEGPRRLRLPHFKTIDT